MEICFPRVKPLKRADFAAGEVRRGLQRMFKDVDLDNPQIQQALRQLTVSSKPIEQIRQLGPRALNQVAKIDMPTCSFKVAGIRSFRQFAHNVSSTVLSIA